MGQLDKWVLESLLSEESWGLAPPTEHSLGLRRRVHVMETLQAGVMASCVQPRGLRDKGTQR